MSEIVDCISWIVQKTCWSFYVFLKFMLLRFLDLLGLVFNIAACLTIVRLPCMIRQFSSMDLEEWRYVGLLQLLIFIFDIPVMIAAAILILTVYRMFPLCKELKEEDCEWDFNKKEGELYYAGCKPRWIILKHFFFLLVDALFIPAILICLLSWRCFMFVRDFKKENDSWERRKTCFLHLFNLFLDIPCIILFIICLCSWRMPLIINHWYEIYKDEHKSFDWDAEKWYSFWHFGVLILDIPCIACFFICLFTWRAPFLIKKLKGKDIFDNHSEFKIKKLAVAQFLLIFVDIPCIIFALFVLVTVWRFPFFVQDCKRAFKKDKKLQWKIRQAAAVQFFIFFIDVLCLLMSIIIFVTLWRAYHLLKKIKKIRGRRYEVTKETLSDQTEPSKLTKVLEVDPDDGNGSQDIECRAAEDEAKVSDQFESEAAGTAIQTEVDAGRALEAEVKDSVEHSNAEVSQAIEGEAISQILEEEQVDSLSSSGVKKQSEVGWKIRKAISIELAWLLIDLPAFCLLPLLVVTFIRVPKILSSFLQSGDIYTEFAITIYFQTFILFVDLVFLLLFLVLMLLRPVQSWVCVLEDEDHMKYRLLCYHMQWIPDIVAKRKQVYEEMNELMSIHLKMYSAPHNYRESMNKILDSYIDELQTVQDRIKNDELDPDFLHLLNTVLWWENKRADKAVRQYQCDYNFLLRPDANLRKENVSKLNREQHWFESKVDEQYGAMAAFVPSKVPLWTISTGLSTRTRRETQNVLINCLPRGNVFLFFLALLCFIPLYRVPKLIKDLCKRWYDRSSIILTTIKEYGLDILTVLRILLVVVFVYRAPFLIADISIDIVDKKSWRAVRKTAKKYPMYIMEDCINLFLTLLSWKTPRFLFTAILFGALMPADMFLTASKFCTKSIYAAYFLSGTLYAIFISFPFIASFYMGKKLLEIGLGWISMPVTCVYVGLLLLILGFMVVAYVRNTDNAKLVPKAADYFHWNWYNIHVIIMEILEFLQLLALVFSFTDIPMYGGNYLHEASRYLLFSFVSFEFKLGIAIALFFIWFFLSAAPVIFEQILEDLPKGTCEGHAGWRMAISLFANTLFVTIIESFASCFSCDYVKCPSGVSYKTLPPNSTCFYAQLTDDISYPCWRDVHRVIALFGLFATLWYTTTAFLVGVQYGDTGNKKQDVEFSATYNVIANFMKAVMVVAVVVITSNRYAVLGILITGNLLLILFTLLFKTIFHYNSTNYYSFVVWRVASFFAAMVASVAVLIACMQNKVDSKTPLMITGIGILVVLIIASIVSIILRRRGLTDEVRDRFKNRLFALEKRLLQENMLLRSWKNQRGSWKHLLHGVREARRGDQVYNEADWTSLQPRQGQDLAFHVAEDAVVSKASNQESGEFIAGDTTDQLPSEEASVNQIETQTSSSRDLSSPPAHDSVQIANDQVPQEEDNSQMERDASATPIIQQNLPPPPAYGSVQIGHDAPDFITSIQLPKDENEIIKTSPFDCPLLSLERNGMNLLLVLEQSIIYKAYAYSFLSQRSVWLSSVILSNWNGLDHCLEVLERSIDYTFEKPSYLDVSLGPKSLPTDALEPDPRDTEEPPSYTPESRDPAVIEDKSKAQRMQALIDVSTIPEHGGHWKELLAKILPTLPVIREWYYDDDSGRFEIILRRPVTATIKDVGPNGIKLAKGASFRLGKVTTGTIRQNFINFLQGSQPLASKGPIQLAVAELKFIWKKGTWYLESEGKSVKYAVALDSIKLLEWK